MTYNIFLLFYNNYPIIELVVKYVNMYIIKLMRSNK